MKILTKDNYFGENKKTTVILIWIILTPLIRDILGISRLLYIPVLVLGIYLLDRYYHPTMATPLGELKEEKKYDENQGETVPTTNHK